MINKILSVKNEKLDKIDLSGFQNVQHWFNLRSGEEHYRLLAYISTLFKGKTLLDIGTYKGDSARALTFGKNEVVTFDIKDNGLVLPGVTVMVGNVLEYNLPSCPFILLDTYHDGDFEREFMDKLREIKYKGIVMLDDIYLGNMRAFWDEIPEEKYDITHIGHHTGTGIVKFK